MHRVQRRVYIRMCGLGVVMAAAIATVALSGSCLLDTKTNLCVATGLRCKQGQVCAAQQDVCIDIGGCGDGIVGEGEVCDDGNLISGDGCSTDCRSLEVCGNYIIDSVRGETCDDGNHLALDDCDPYCQAELCGNGRLDPEEACDDDNAMSRDGCRNDCQSNEACGNGVLDDHLLKPEQCDLVPVFPELAQNSELCDSDCTLPECGDGHLNPEYLVPGSGHREQCDPDALDQNGDALDSQSCDRDCTFVKCGDGIVNVAAGELCEEGGVDTRTCDGDCTRPVCGDHRTNPLAPSNKPGTNEQCDAGGVDTSSCDGDCTLRICGDGYHNMTVEECDPGRPGRDSSACDFDCTAIVCGDGYRNEEVEACDTAVDDPCPGDQACAIDCLTCI